MGGAPSVLKPTLACVFDSDFAVAGTTLRGKAVLNAGVDSIETVKSIGGIITGKVTSQVRYETGAISGRKSVYSLTEETKEFFKTEFKIAEFRPYRPPSCKQYEYEFHLELPADLLPTMALTLPDGHGNELRCSYVVDLWLEIKRSNYGPVRTSREFQVYSVGIVPDTPSAAAASQPLRIGPSRIIAPVTGAQQQGDVAIGAIVGSTVIEAGAQDVPLQLAIQNASSFPITAIQLQVFQEVEIKALALSRVKDGRQVAKCIFPVYETTVDPLSCGLSESNIAATNHRMDPGAIATVESMLNSGNAAKILMSIPSHIQPSFTSEVGSVTHSLTIKLHTSNNLYTPEITSKGICIVGGRPSGNAPYVIPVANAVPQEQYQRPGQQQQQAPPSQQKQQSPPPQQQQAPPPQQKQQGAPPPQQKQQGAPPPSSSPQPMQQQASHTVEEARAAPVCAQASGSQSGSAEQAASWTFDDAPAY